MMFQIVLLGDADEIVHHLCERLQWDLPPLPNPSDGLQAPPRQANGKRRSGEMMGLREPERVLGSHVWLFSGAEGGKWVEDIKERYSNDTNGASGESKSHSERATKKARVS